MRQDTAAITILSGHIGNEVFLDGFLSFIIFKLLADERLIVGASL